MTNGNDLVEYEEKNHSQLIERWAEKCGVKTDVDDYVALLEEDIMEDPKYWEFVEERYNDDMAYYSERDNEWRYGR